MRTRTAEAASLSWWLAISTLVCWKLWVKCFLRPNIRGARFTFTAIYSLQRLDPKMKLVAKLLTQESEKIVREKAKAVSEELRLMKQKKTP